MHSLGDERPASIDVRVQVANATAASEVMETRKRRRVEAAQRLPMALVVIDLQNDFCHPDGVFGRAGMGPSPQVIRGIVARVNELVGAARAGAHLVVWTQMAWTASDGPGLLAAHSPLLASEGLRAGSWGAELLPGLERRSDDAVVRKSRFSAFHKTGLEDMLRAEGVRSVVVAGLRTDFCVESTVREAFFLDFEVFVVADAVTGKVTELHEHSLREMNTVFAQVIDQGEALALLKAREPSSSVSSVRGAPT